MTKIQLACPGSKSMTQRAIFLAALSVEPSRVEGALDCDDSSYLSNLLRCLGAEVSWDGNQVGIKPPKKYVGNGEPIFCGNAGTTVRFSSALSLIMDGVLSIDGDHHMRRRPIGGVAQALEKLGVSVSYLINAGFPPIELERRQEIAETLLEIDSSQSSQFVSAILMVAPLIPDGLRVRLSGAVVSRSYLDMTIKMMASAEVDVQWEGSRDIIISPGRYRRLQWEVEADWSAAAFLLTAGAIIRRPVEIAALVDPSHSLQGDSSFVDFEQKISRAKHPIKINLNNAPDLLPPLVCRALFGDQPVTFTDIAHARIKECDRIAVLARELRKIGGSINEYADGMTIHPLNSDLVPKNKVELDPESDHRMAMSFGILSLAYPQVKSREPQCVSKSFPNFWQVLDEIRSQM